MNKKKQAQFNEYLDEILPENPRDPHPYFRFHLHEIVKHPIWGHGIITGTRIPDFERELEGLGVQFVCGGVMKEHKVFTPVECNVLETTGFVFHVKDHEGMTLEEVVTQERGDAPLPGLR